MTEQVLPPLFVGDFLKEARELRGLSLAAVSKALCITKSQLALLEEDRGTLPCNVYTIGFLKSYAEFLGLNSGALVQQLKEQTMSFATPSRLTFPPLMPEKGMPSRRLVLFSLLGLVCLIVGYVGWERYTSEKSAFLPSVLSPVLSPAHSRVSAPVAPQVAPLPVRLVATETTWVEVKDKQGNILLRRLLYQGNAYTFSTPSELTLRTGNAGGVQLIAGEKMLDFPEEHGIVRSEIPLDSDQWHRVFEP